MACNRSIRIRHATTTDAQAWLELRVALWPDGSRTEHAAEIQLYFAGKATEPQAVLLAEDPVAGIVGLAELSIRPCAEGCRTNRVAYLEGWFVAAEFRGRGHGRALVRAAEAWAAEQGCSEFASDAEANNEASIAAHLAVGFHDAGLVRCFKKDLLKY